MNSVEPTFLAHEGRTPKDTPVIQLKADHQNQEGPKHGHSLTGSPALSAVFSPHSSFSHIIQF